MITQMNRLMSFDDVVEKYGGTRAIWEKLMPYLPVWQVHDGQPVYLESEVDEFLRQVYQRRGKKTAPAATDELTTEQAANYLGISLDTLSRHVKAGRIARRSISPPDSGKPRYRYRVEELERFKREGYRRMVPPPDHTPKARTAKTRATPFSSPHLDLD